MHHFVKCQRISPENPALMIYDNHASHINVAVIDFCKEKGVVLLSLPPPTSHKLQPLDRSVFGPLKKYLADAMEAWMKSNPGKTMTIYDVAELAGKALPKASTPSNIMSGFRVSGIFPFNRNVFEDWEFAPSNVTDRPV